MNLRQGQVDMNISKLLPAIALAIALAPFAAMAQTAPQPAPGAHHTIVHSGAGYFRDSFGG
jgi:hypothetical protein